MRSDATKNKIASAMHRFFILSSEADEFITVFVCLLAARYGFPRNHQPVGYFQREFFPWKVRNGEPMIGGRADDHQNVSHFFLFPRLPPPFRLARHSWQRLSLPVRKETSRGFSVTIVKTGVVSVQTMSRNCHSFLFGVWNNCWLTAKRRTSTLYESSDRCCGRAQV
jgi:hypothetical protein